jgi:predicted transcriptional regulator
MNVMPRSKKPQSDDETGTLQVSMRLPASLVRRLDELAEQERRSRSNAVVLLLERALEARQAG